MKIETPLVKNVLAPLGITAGASAIDAGIQENIHDSGTTTLIISIEEMNDIMKIVQTLEDSNILLKGVSKTFKNETKEQKGGFLSMLFGTLGASLLGNLLAGKGILRAGSGHHSLNSFTSYGNRKWKGIVKAATGKQWDFNAPSSFNKSIIIMNQDLMVFFQEVILH